jgi:hypothetical protein
MYSLKITRSVVSEVGAQIQTIIEAQHQTHTTLYNLYDLLIDNDALEGGDEICYKAPKTTHKYHICMTCCKRAIEGAAIHCSDCSKGKRPKLKLNYVRAPLPKYYKY